MLTDRHKAFGITWISSGRTGSLRPCATQLRRFGEPAKLNPVVHTSVNPKNPRLWPHDPKRNAAGDVLVTSSLVNSRVVYAVPIQIGL